MFRIRRIHDAVLPVNRRALAKAQALLRERFPGAPVHTIEGLPEGLHDPLRHRLRTVVLVAETRRGLRGCAVLMYAPDLEFCYLEFIAASASDRGRGIGGALYQRAREECLVLGAKGLFFECLPDDPGLTSNPALAAENAARLRFYEGYGARPIANTAYETPMKVGDLDAPHLVFDDLGTARTLSRDEVRAIVRAILERTYAWLCPPEYIDQVVQSVVEDPVALRPPRYAAAPVRGADPLTQRIALVVHDRHEPHHIRERGYVEAPARVQTIRGELLRLEIFDEMAPEEFPDEHIERVHDRELVEYLRTVCAQVPEGESVYPYVFPIRNTTRPPKSLDMRAGYYCIDTFTPLNKGAWVAARRAVDCTLTAARALRGGRHTLAYALVRPPGHHAERRSFGGFCYLNNAAIAAEMLATDGPVAILDVDYHHGNGQQVIFYERADVFTVSIHGDPAIAYPYFSGFADELGAGPGLGANLNMPLAETATNAEHAAALAAALTKIRGFAPRHLVVCLGLDTARGDPTGSWGLGSAEFEAMGAAIGGLRLPTLVVQEGGYNRRNLGVHARHFFHGLSRAHGA